MARSFDVQTLVQLPKFTALGALAAGTQILQVAGAEKKKLPAQVARARDKLAAAVAALRDAAKDRLPTGAAEGAGVDVRKLDAILDARWSSTLGLLDAWLRLPGAPEGKAAAAKALEASLFASGLAFTQLAYALEWASRRRGSNLIAAQGLEAHFATLDAQVFLAAIKKAHKAYGDALGMTAAKAQQVAAAVTLREPADAVQKAMRAFVVTVSAHGADEDVPGAPDVAARLLTPLAAWESAPAAKSAAAADPAPVGPAGPPDGSSTS